jgi:hypothetical protein
MYCISYSNTMGVTAELKPMSTPMSMATSMDPDENDETTDQR